MDNHKAAEAGQGGDREEIFRTLKDLMHQSRCMIRNDRFTLDDARKLASYVTAVRTLLTELGEIEAGMQRSDRSLASIHDLKERYFGLEGEVKEARNRLARSSLPV